MVKARAWLALGLVSLGTVAATVSCGSDETTGVGGLITGGGGGTVGTDTGGATAVGRGGGSTAVGLGGSAGSTGSGALGSPCKADANCGAGLTCLQPNGTELGGGGPPDGLCTLVCTTNDDCTPAEPGAGCVTFDQIGTTGYCFESCVTGNPMDPTTKCQGRADFLCVDLSTTGAGDTFCQPQCQNDAECGPGVFCNPIDGLCEATKPTGDPVGTACDPNAATNTCLGFCITTSAANVTPATGTCVEPCSGVTECMFTGTKAGGFCAGGNPALFDIGYCEPACNCDSDCPIPGDVCQAWGTGGLFTQLQTDLGTAGFCFPNALGSTELTCSGGEAGAGNTPGAAGAAN